ncbi:hypothetical protein ADEAN_000714100 [Angomonas deanei]|uniref:Uncharacterized protein n=1 Tax=Angomonas deanei TaxID=59799 RepID=A0A7G2CN48_9TRYP|nr:hypothetical protein ADEAN_000714100 [Angomonas deanei]
MPVRRYGSAAPTPAASVREGSIISHQDPNAPVDATPTRTPPRVSAASRLQPRSSPGSASRSLNQSRDRAAPQEESPMKEVALNCRTTDEQRAIYEGIKNTAPIPQLQEPRRTKQYVESSVQDSLYRIVDANDIIMVAGAFFGDEGKGKNRRRGGPSPKVHLYRACQQRRERWPHGVRQQGPQVCLQPRSLWSSPRG